MRDLTPSELLQRARVLVEMKRPSLREAKSRRARAVKAYGQALDQMQPRHEFAVSAYVAALTAEAAANRADARELRELLAEIIARATRTENKA